MSWRLPSSFGASMRFLWTEKSHAFGASPRTSAVRRMHLIAHRGWSAGGDENSLAAFARAARDEAVTGVEFDVSRAADSGAGAVAHDPALYTENALTLDAALSFSGSDGSGAVCGAQRAGARLIGDREARFQQVSRPLGGVRVCRRGAILSVGRCAACAPGRHCHVSLEFAPHCAPLCTGCSLAAGTRTVGRGLRFARGGLFSPSNVSRGVTSYQL
jgi:hypothetical protein